MLLISVAFVLAQRVEIYRNDHKKLIQIKKHGRRAYSFSKYGLIFIPNTLLNPFGIWSFEINTSGNDETKASINFCKMVDFLFGLYYSTLIIASASFLVQSNCVNQ